MKRREGRKERERETPESKPSEEWPMLKGNWLPKMFHQIARRKPHQDVLREALGTWDDNMSEVISEDRGSLPSVP